MLDRENDPPYCKIMSIDLGIFIIVAGILVLAMQETGSKYVNNTHFDTDSGNPLGLITDVQDVSTMSCMTSLALLVELN